MVLVYDPTSHLSGTQFLPCWFSTAATNGSPMQKTQKIKLIVLRRRSVLSEGDRAEQGSALRELARRRGVQSVAWSARTHGD